MTAAAPGWLAPYRAVFGARFRMLLQYRAGALGGMWTQTFFGLVLIMVYDAFYRSAPPEARPMRLDQVTSYVWLGQALLAMLPWNIDSEMRVAMRSGAVAYELCRPVDLYAWWYARSVAQRTAPALLRAVPIAVIAAVGLPLVGLDEWRLAPPASLASAAAFTVELVCAVALTSAISVLLYLTMMWTIVAEGAVMILSTAVALFSGMLVPLPLLPEWLQPALGWLPFAGLLDLPARTYSGHLAAGELGLAVARQLGWTAVLIALGRRLLGRGLRRVVIDGG